MKKFLQNIVKLKEISTIKDFRFGTFPSISGSGSGYTFYRPPVLMFYSYMFPSCSMTNNFRINQYELSRMILIFLMVQNKIKGSSFDLTGRHDEVSKCCYSSLAT